MYLSYTPGVLYFLLPFPPFLRKGEGPKGGE